MDDKAERSKAVSSQERDLLLHKTIEERKGKQIVPILFLREVHPLTFIHFLGSKKDIRCKYLFYHNSWAACTEIDQAEK